MESTKIRWNQIAVEAVAIVTSILLAFTIDAWWEERNERVDERTQLRRLHGEFLTNIKRIDVREFEGQILDATIEVFSLIDNAQIEGREEIVVSASTIGMMLTAPTFDADTPILNGLVRSGRLEIIQNDKVVALISEWDRTLYDYTTFAERARRSVDERLLPALIVRGDVGPILMTQPAAFNTYQADQLDSVVLKVDEELKGLVAERWRKGRTALTRFLAARAVAGKLVAEIESSW